MLLDVNDEIAALRITVSLKSRFKSFAIIADVF